MAHGQCDNLLLATYLSATCPVVVAPAMDEDMWHHPATQAKSSATADLLEIRSFLLKKANWPVDYMVMEEWQNRNRSFNLLIDNFFLTRPLAGKKVLVTAGPTYEAIDPVRFIGNHSSGKMGIAIAKELYRQGADVSLILGPYCWQFFS